MSTIVQQPNILQDPAPNINTVDDLDTFVERAATAQEIYADYDQDQVDEIFRQAALAANRARLDLAKLAAEETDMGVMEDKVIKNHFAAEYIYNKYRDTKTCGLIEEDDDFGVRKYAEPVGVVAGIIPTTNPTSTTIFKALIALKTRNAIVFSPHPRAKECTARAAAVIREAVEEAGAPADLVGCIQEPTLELTQRLMEHERVAMILATGGPGMVDAAYSSGKPAIGVGAGNTPAVIDETADVQRAVNSILLSKTFDNGMICSSEQSAVVVDAKYRQVKREFDRRGAYLLDDREADRLRDTIVEDGELNVEIVGQPAEDIAAMAGLDVPESTRALVAEAEGIGADAPLSYEKLSPVLALYRAHDFEGAVDKAERLVEFAGEGHTSVLYTNPENADRIREFGNRMNTGRVLTNMPSSQGAIGDIYNFRLEPSLTLGCGTWGGNSVSENVGVKHLLNTKTVAERRESMLWYRVPPKVYFKYGCLPQALQELENRERAFVVTDETLCEMGYARKITDRLDDMDIDWEVFDGVEPDPTFDTVQRGVRAMNEFEPDTIIALGGGSPMDAAKIMWLMYEDPDVSFDGLAARFMDIRKRVYEFPDMGRKATMVAVPTTSGTGSEVTPFAVVTDRETGVKYPITDYELTPDMAIVDPQLVTHLPPELTAYSGFDALVHALEAVTSVLATEYTDGQALEAIRLLFRHLPDAYEKGAEAPEAREKVHHAATMAGMAFANAFLGVCHSMAHKLGAAFHMPHGLANALLVNQVVRFNATDAPRKQGISPQYEYPCAKERYARVADYLDLGGETADEKVDNLVEALEDLKQRLDIPPSIAEAGIEKDDWKAELDEMAELAFDDQCTGANPRYPLVSEIKDIYRQAYLGKH